MVKKRYEISKFLNAIVRRKDNADNEKEIKKSEDKNLEELKTDCSDRRADTPFLYFTILTVLLLIMVGSSAMTWTSPALIQLKMNNTRVNPLGRPIKTIEISMLLGIPMMANLVGSSVLPMLSDILGRKKMLYMCGVGFLMSTIGTAFSNRIYLLLLFNSITFCIQGASYALIPMYLTEVCEDHNRAKFGCIMTLFMPLGQLLTYLDGSVLKIKYFTLINSVPLLPFLAFFLVAPESPVYSMAKGRREQCLKSLKRLRGNKTEMEIQKDLEKINLGMEVQENRKRESKFLTIFYTKEGRLGLVFATLPMLFQYLSGAPIIIGLLAPIFDETKTLSGNTIAIIVGCVKVSCFFFISTIVERTGRKPLLVISCAGASMSLLLLAVYFYLLSIDSPAIQQLKFLPLLAVVLFIILYSVGLGSLPLSIISELFPSNLRPLAISIVTTFTAAISAVYSFGYPLLAEHIGTHWCFFIFSCCSLIGAFVMYFILPETKENEDVKSNNEEVLENRPETLFTYFTIGTAFLLIMVGGSTVVWSSPAVVKMKLDDPNENPLGKPIEAVELSILIGLPTVSGLLGCFIIPKLADIVGRKYTLLAIGSVWLLSLIATSFSRNLIMFTSFICISMALQAASFAAVPIYLTEICQHHSRAKLGCILCVFIPIGELITYLVGSVFSIRDFTLIIASPLVVFLVLFHLAPESPVYSLTKGSVEECRRSLKKLRSNKTEKELNIEYDQIKESLDLQEVKSEFVILTLLKSKEGRFGLLLGTIPIVIQYLTGATLVLQLMGPIFDEANTFAGNTIAIIVGIAKVCCFLLASFLVERTGRKPLLIISCVGTGISTAVLSVYFYLNYINDPVIEDLKLLPLIAVLFFIMSYSMGIGPIPLAVISELFPSHARSVAMSFILMFCGVVLTVYNSSYPILDEYAGTHWCFFMFSFFSLLGAVVIYFVVPETKGKSDAEIQQILADY